MEKFPTLYKKTATGAIQFWDICASELPEGTGVISTKYGQIGTDSPQVTVDYIGEGKNVGKKNETTAYHQAVKEAKAKWEKQKKKGYVDSIMAAQSGEVDSLVEGGIFPMLAQSYSKHASKIKFPCYVQPKLDGIRCIAVVKNGKCTLWSRTRKPINSMPHIVAALEEALYGQDAVLDGELYNHKFKDSFEEIVSLVRLDKPHPEGKYTNVQYHVYDTASTGIFADRNSELYQLLATVSPEYVKLVLTGMLNSDEEVTNSFAIARGVGYEGIMLRNGEGKYTENKRSYDLQKVKEFDDAEFEIVGVEEGRGKLAGHVGAFLCRTENGKEFLAKMSGEIARLKDYFENHALWSGKRLTVQYQGLTGKEGVPRFPVGLRIREEE